MRQVFLFALGWPRSPVNKGVNSGVFRLSPASGSFLWLRFIFFSMSRCYALGVSCVVPLQNIQTLGGKTMIIGVKNSSIRSKRKNAPALLAFATFSVLAFSGGCSYFDPPPFSGNEVKWADRSILFREIEHHPHALEGQHVILGGEIISVKREGLLGQVDVREYPLGKELHPDHDKPSMGTFEILTDEPLPEDRYKAGRDVEVMGTISKPVTRKLLDGTTKIIPVIRAHHIHAASPPPPPMPYDEMMGPMDGGFGGGMYPGMMGPGMGFPGFF